MRRLFSNRLWIFVTLAFLALIAAWSTLIIVAQRNQPEPIPIVK
jgi:hypothetical protein